MRKHHKIITRVIVFVMLGAIVNVAVAWACAFWINAYDHGHGADERIADTDLP